MRIVDALAAAQEAEASEPMSAEIVSMPPEDGLRLVPPAPEGREPVEDRGSILPFFGVLFRGRDLSLFAQARPGDAHPSVGYVQTMYFAIFINWIIDTLGLGYLLHGYLDGFASRQTTIGISAGVGLALSTGFATFAAGLAKRPLRAATLSIRDRRIFLPIALSLLLTAIICLLSSRLWGSPRGSTYEFASALSWLTIASFALWLIVASFGTLDAMFITARVIVMFGVGAVVADPLHQAMFRQEIGVQVYEDSTKKTNTENAALLVSCLEEKKIEDDCKPLEKAVADVEFLLVAYEAQMSCEAHGAGATECASREKLREQAEATKNFEAAAVLAEPLSGTYGKKARYSDLKARRDAIATTRLAEAKEKLATCQKERTGCIADHPILSTSDASTKPTGPDVTRAPSAGPIARATAFENLIRGQNGPLVERALLVAWLLALVMPFLVLVMKLTGGPRLEPYLHRRWRGR